MAWTSPSTWVAGAVLTAAQLNEQVRDNLLALGAAWTSFTPTPTSGITALGNAVVDAGYREAGKDIKGAVHITMGSTTTFASGEFLLTLPVAAAAPANTPIGTCFVQDGGGLGTRRGGTVILASSTSAYFLADDVANNAITNTAPWTWASTDTLAFSFSYEAA